MSRKSRAKGPKLRVCIECGGEFYSKYPRRTCSNRCWFWSQVDRSGGLDACWLWKGHTCQTTGYGDVPARKSPTGRREAAHRVAFCLHNTCDPGALWVLHKCDNRACQNPQHLFLGTVRANNLDCWLKGRAFVAPGSDNGNAKLTDASVRLIRESNEPGPRLAALFGVSRGTVHMVRSRSTWRHLT